MTKLVMTMICFISIAICHGQSDSLNFYLKKGQESISTAQTLQAYQYYKQATSFDSRNPDALRGLANAASELKYYAIARETYKKLLELKPNDPAAVGQLAQMNFNTHQWTDAIDMAKRANTFSSGTNNDWIIGKSYYETGEFGSAAVYLEKAWKKDSSNAETAFTLARSYVELGQYPKATECYERALRLAPDNEVWMYEVAMTYSAIPDEVKAVIWFEKAIGKGYPRTREVMGSMVISYMGAKAYDKCLKLANEILAAKPDDLEMLYMGGEASYRLGKLQDAINYWEKMLTIDKNQSRAIFMIGIAYIKSGENSKGESLCDKAIAMDPSLASLKNNRSQFGL
jgi:tetratricopeptide (TPR) repeat protein